MSRRAAKTTETNLTHGYDPESGWCRNCGKQVRQLCELEVRFDNLDRRLDRLFEHIRPQPAPRPTLTLIRGGKESS